MVLLQFRLMDFQCVFLGLCLLLGGLYIPKRRSLSNRSQEKDLSAVWSLQAPLTDPPTVLEVQRPGDRKKTPGTRVFLGCFCRVTTGPLQYFLWLFYIIMCFYVLSSCWNSFCPKKDPSFSFKKINGWWNKNSFQKTCSSLLF